MGCLVTHWYFSFSAPWSTRGSSCLAMGAFPVSQMVLELPVPFTTRQEALHRSRWVFWFFFPFNTLSVVRDTVGFKPISITLFELWQYAKFSSPWPRLQNSKFDIEISAIKSYKDCFVMWYENKSFLLSGLIVNNRRTSILLIFYSA